jgi:signal transduction histidine kinase
LSSKILKHLYEVVAREATFGIVVFRDDGDCLFVNRVAQLMLNTEEPALIALFPGTEKPPFKSFSNEILKHEGMYQDILVRKENHGSFVAHIGVKHIAFDGVHAHLLMLQDVTIKKKLQRDLLSKQNEIKSAYEEVLYQNRKLKELNDAKTKFIALTTHELRTPLSAMVASAEILKLGLYDSPEQMHEFIEMLHEQGRHLQLLVNDILDFAKIQAGKMDFMVEQQDVVPLTQMIFSNFLGLGATNNISLIFESPKSKLLCYVDELRLRQVFSNVVSNAIKFNSSGGKVRVHFSENDEFVSIYVDDTGKGIPPEHVDKVFNEFETVGQVNTHQKGTGLGMPISRKLCEGMGGNLSFESEVGMGSTFRITLPKHKVLAESFYQSRAERTPRKKASNEC